MGHRPLHAPLRAAFLFLSLAVLAGVAPSAARAADVGFRVSGEPGSVLQNGFLVASGAPGWTIDGHFFATNASARGASLSVYPADGLTGATTGAVYGQAGEPLTGGGAWVTPDRRSLSLGGKDERRIDFSIKVPTGAAPGDHVAAVVLEQRGASRGNVSQVIRNVVPILIDVVGFSKSAVAVRSAAITNLPGTKLPAVTVTLRNTGNRICRPVLTVELNPPGKTPQVVTRELDVILPGDRAPFPLPWPAELNNGAYLVKAIVTGCGETQTVSKTITADLDSGDATGGGKKANDLLGRDRTGSGSKGASSGDSGGKNGGGGGGKDGKGARRTDGNGNGDGSGDSAGSAFGPGAGGGKGGDDGGAAAAGAAKVGGSASGADGLDLDGPWWQAVGRSAIDYAPAALLRLSVPLLLLVLMGLFILVQEAIDRRDPKLMLAPVHRDPDLPFETDLFGHDGVISLSTPLIPPRQLPT